MKKTCVDGQVRTDAVCRPIALFSQANTTVAKLERARLQLKSAREQHDQAPSASTEQELSAVILLINSMLPSLVEDTSLGDGTAAELHATEALRQEALDQLSSLVAELRLALGQLEVNTEIYNDTESELRRAEISFQTMQTELVTLQLQLAGLISNSTTTSNDITNDTNSEMQDLQQAIEEYKARQAELELQMRKRLEEQERKNAEKESTNVWLILVLVLLIACCIGTVFAAIFAVQRSKDTTPVVDVLDMEGHVASDGGVMVVGRPVADSGGPAGRGGGAPGQGGSEKGDLKGGKTASSDEKADLKGGAEKLRSAGLGKDGSAPPPKAAW